MLNQDNRYIKLILFRELVNWDAKFYLNDDIGITSIYDLYAFSYFTKAAIINPVIIEDDKEYKILGVRSYGFGAYLNRISKGSALKMKKYQKAKVNHLFWCKVDTKNGAFGIITEELKDGLGSTNMTFAEIDQSKIYVDYLQILFRSKVIHSYMDSMVTGTTNRKYIKFRDLLSNVKIPLPSLDEQNALVASYNSSVEQAQAQEQQAKTLEAQIETYLLDKLGIKINSLTTKNKILHIFKFSNITDRWDLLSMENSIFNALKQSNFKVVEISNAYNFISRSWSPLKHNYPTFKYIELGAIDTLKGITKVVELHKEKRPSRATQFVKTGDLIIGTTRPYLKKFSIVSKQYNDNVCSSGFQVINSDENNLHFLYEYLKSEAGIEQFKFYMTGALYPAITGKDLRKIKIPLPPLEIQNEIVSHITNIKSQITTLKAQAQTNRTTALTQFEQQIFN